MEHTTMKHSWMISLFIALLLCGQSVFTSEPPSSCSSFDCSLQAAKAGNAEAQLNIASMYETGDGITNNNKKAFEWTHAAAKQALDIANICA